MTNTQYTNTRVAECHTGVCSIQSYKPILALSLFDIILLYALNNVSAHQQSGHNECYAEEREAHVIQLDPNQHQIKAKNNQAHK